MTSFNISGCCTLMDAFGFQEKNKHEIIHFLQFTSPVTWFKYLSKPEKIFSVEDLAELSIDGILKRNFSKKCVVNDYNRTVLNYFQEKADYFIFDFTEMVRYGLVKQVIDDNRVHYFTATGRVMDRNSQNKNFLDLLSGKKEIISVDQYLSEELISEVMDNLKIWVCEKKGYKCEQIILVRTMNAVEYYDGTMMRSFPNRKKLEHENIHLEKIYSEFERKFKGCNVVRMPNNVYGIIPHKWGLLSLHFCNEVYDYLYNAFNMIANKCSGGVDTLCDVTENLLEANRKMFILQERYYILEMKGNRYKYLSDRLIENITKEKEKYDTIIAEPLLKVDIHFSMIGWKSNFTVAEMSKDIKKYQIEALRISCMDKSFDGDIYYAAKVGYRQVWTDTYKNGQMVGTTGKSLPISAVKIWLDEKAQEKYEITYEFITESNCKYNGSNGIPVEIGLGDIFVGANIELKEKHSG